MGRLEELHLKESQIWAKMKSCYEEATMANKRKIENLKKALDKVQARIQTITDNVRVLLQTNRERFTTQLKAMLDKGWAAWTTHAVELHTYWADWENRRKQGRGFYKLNEERILHMIIKRSLTSTVKNSHNCETISGIVRRTSSTS